ncbi:hypothetical protein KG090_00530 [Carnobacteriaceae bacterium zg-ZUI240]|nr:hypothetical protein [Carnobacteriaceae bacterium zg-ZUI240]
MKKKTELSYNHRVILEEIAKRNFECPIPLENLCQIIKKSDRTVKGLIYDLKTMGICILARRVATQKNKKGYFIPKNETERQIGLASFKKQIKTELEIIEIMQSADLNAHKEFLEV